VSEEDTVWGQVKWFDATKGFGFVVADKIDVDILLHANVLRGFGRNSIAGGSRLEVIIQQTDRGCQATEILNIEQPELDSSTESLKAILGVEILGEPDQELLPARVKWFDRGKGFGFVNVFGKSEDIFVHMEVLHACGLAELQPGEAVCIRTAIGPRGKMAWDVRVWDYAATGSKV